MKFKILLFSLLVSTFSFSQNFEEQWKEVMQLELDGKTKSADEIVTKIYKKANRKNNEPEIIKCFFYKSKFLQVLDENASEKIVLDIKEEIKEASKPSKGVLNYIYAQLLTQYLNKNATNIYKRTPIQDNTSQDFSTWSYQDFTNEIEKAFDESVKYKVELRQTSVKDYKEIFKISPFLDGANYSLYDFLSVKYIQFLTSKHNFYGISKTEAFIQSSNLFYENSERFIKIDNQKFDNKNFQKLISFYQEKEIFAKNQNLRDQFYFERLQFFHDEIKNYDLFVEKLSALEKETNFLFLKQNIRIELAKHYHSEGYNTKDKEKVIQALEYAELVLSQNENNNALFEAEYLKNNIQGKSLNITVKKTLYANQNIRAFINFKNIDTLKVSYFKLPSKNNKWFKSYSKNTKDSLVNNFISKNKPLKTYYKTLPKGEKLFNSSTEILLEKIEVGNYLLVIENKTNSNSLETIKSYEHITVTNMIYHSNYNNKEEVFFIYDRKTGKPIENVIVKNNDTSTLSNKNGKAFFLKKEYKKDENNFSSLHFIKDNDTIVDEYYKERLLTNEYEENEEVFEAKANVYFDRAIYRPGQKVLYKGIIIENKNKKKNIVPFLSVAVKIEDVNNKIIKEYEVQTNEYGSFSGEFDIPKNVLTGEFSLYISEPENYEIDKKYYNEKEDEHSFWDYVDFDEYGNFSFKVEEYKRPTFEINFNDIKERYTIGDTLKIKGNAKALAGSNITEAKVKYTFSKSILDIKDNYSEYVFEKETKTDNEGNFEIELIANDSILKNNQIENISFYINVEITDLNGETKIGKKEVYVNQKTIKLLPIVNNEYFKEDNNKITIKSTNYNNYPIDCKGEIKIYQIKEKTFLINRNTFPELKNISREEFTNLFPHEPYESSDLDSEKILIKTIFFDTQKERNINLSFLKTLNLGKYQADISTIDIKGDTIQTSNNFTLNSKVNPHLNKTDLFTFKPNDNPNLNYFEIVFYSAIPNLYITTRAYEDENEFHLETIQLVNGKGILKIRKKQNLDNSYQFQFVSFWENSAYEKNHKINKIIKASKLDFEILSIRNKIEPGSLENWVFKIKDQKLESEILASMYDSSLDLFSKQNWQNTYFYEYEKNPNKPQFYYLNREFDTKTMNIYGLQNNIQNFTYLYIPKPEINWYGFEYLSKNITWSQRKYQKELNIAAEIPNGAKLVYGVVSDELGPIPGANIIIKGTTRETTTDFDGKYQIFALTGETLVITYTGKKMVSNEIDSSMINISLKDDIVEGKFVEIVGAMGIKRKVDAITSSDLIISGAELSQASNPNVLQSLAGKVSGLTVETATNGVNPSTRIVLRGNRSISGNNEALVVIDGIISNANILGNIKPDAIHEVSVLKGAQGAALYGEQGVNGVIIVTTKQGLQQVTQVKTRTNFNETAFFYPHLTTDSEGKVNFKFTTPESLTKWKLRMYAHNKKAETGYLEADIISQKDLMIMPNMPRFVRENDSITVTAKVANLTNEAKSGIALLQLFDATTGKSIDVETLNSKNTKNFNCKAKENVAVSWTISIPEGLQGLQYKIIAKSGNFSDGEENILPVLSNSILVTESIPLWVREKSKKEVVFENLKNNDSKTLRNHLFTLEYTSNPVWMAIQSLPYLMEYEHECAEQTFSRYYANFIAKQIIESNPKVASVLESWKNQGKTKSKLEINEELKSILLAETPWFFDADEDAKNKQLAVLFDLNKLKESSDATFKKLEDKMMPSGGFPWFNGGNESRYITQHILGGLGHLDKLFPNSDNNFDNITKKAIPYLDAKFIESKRLNKLSSPSYNPTDIHYLYTRSFYLKQYPISKQIDSIIKVDLADLKKKWLNYSLYQKGMMALVMHRFNEKEFAKKIITHLKETSASNENDGMYWIDNRSGYYWYESKIETQALIIEAFAEIENDTKSIDAMKVWLIRNKQSKNWSTTKSTSEAIYALLLQGTDWTTVKDNTKFKIGNEKILSQKLSNKDKEAETGYIKMNWSASEITKEMATISVDNRSEVPGYGGVYWQYFENLEKIKNDTKGETQIQKEIFKNVTTKAGTELVPISKEALKVGDLITIRLTIKTEVDLEYVHLKDLRASCFEPVNVISKYVWEGLSYYMSTKDVATHFFFDSIKRGTYIIDYEVRVTNSGSFNNGIATLQSMYAPEFSSHSKSEKVKIN